jgi:hypothetical protein
MMIQSNDMHDFNTQLALHFDRNRLEQNLHEFYKYTSYTYSHINSNAVDNYNPSDNFRWSDMFIDPNLKLEDESIQFSIIKGEESVVDINSLSTFDREYAAPVSISPSVSSEPESLPVSLAQTAGGQSISAGYASSLRPLSPLFVNMPLSNNIQGSKIRPFSPSRRQVHSRRGSVINRRPFSPNPIIHGRPNTANAPSISEKYSSTEEILKDISIITGSTIDTHLDDSYTTPNSMHFHAYQRPWTARSGAGSSRHSKDDYTDISFVSGTSSIVELKMRKRNLEKTFADAYAVRLRDQPPSAIELNVVREKVSKA